MRNLQLKCFVTVANEGSIRKAAEKLNLAASALSRRITQIEEDIGVPMFERHARGLRLTDAGQIYFDHARTTLRQEAWAIGEIEAIKNLRRGQIRVVCVEGAIGGIMSEAIAEFRPKSPNVNLSVTRAGSTGVVRSVAADEAELGLAFDPPTHRDVMVIAEVPAPLYAVFAPGFPMPDGHLSLAYLATMPLAIPPDSSYGIRDVIDRVVRQKADIELDPPLLCDSIYGLTGFALRGQGVSILPMCAVIDEVRAGRLLIRSLSDPPLRDARLVLMGRRHRELPAVARRFCSILTRSMQAASY